MTLATGEPHAFFSRDTRLRFLRQIFPAGPRGFLCRMYLTLTLPHFDCGVHVLAQQFIGEDSGSVVRVACDRTVIDDVVPVVEEVTAILRHGRTLRTRTA